MHLSEVVRVRSGTEGHRVHLVRAKNVVWKCSPKNVLAFAVIKVNISVTSAVTAYR